MHIKLEKFKELNTEDLKRLISNINYTYCESDPFLINDIKDAKNICLLYNTYFKIVNMSITQAEFSQGEKLGVIKRTYNGKSNQNYLRSY